MVRLFKSSDVGAPALSSSAGSLITVLDYCLLNAGWTKPYAGGNRATYRQGAGSGFYLYVNDQNVISAGSAHLRGWEVSTDHEAGDHPFPLTTLHANGLEHIKTGTHWWCVCDERTLYFFNGITSDEGNTITIARKEAFAFGDFYSYQASDRYNCMIIADTNVEGMNLQMGQLLLQGGQYVGGRLTGHFLARPHTGFAGAMQRFLKHGDFTKAGGDDLIGANSLQASVRWPNGPDGNVFIGRIPVIEQTNDIRGRLRGLWEIPNINLSTHRSGDTLTGVGDLSGRTFMIVRPAVNNQYYKMYCVEISDTWDTN